VLSSGIESGSTTQVTLTAKDTAGVQETSGGATFSFGLGSGTGSGTFSNLTDHNDGTYTATFTGTTIGTNTITATINGQPVSSKWANAPSMATPRGYQTATVLGNGNVLVAGGLDNNNVPLASAELYHPDTNTWSSAGSMTSPRRQQGATLLSSGKVLVATGDNNGSLPSADLYDPATNTWSATGPMIEGRGAPTATRLNNGEVLVAGGYDAGYLNSSELYNPATNTWSAAAPMSLARDGASAILLGSGKVLVFGGEGYIAEAELYDPTSNTWSSAGSMASGRGYSTATLLISGKVLVAGGAQNATAELYDPTSNTWSSAGTMSAVHEYATATLLGNGKVLVAGSEQGENAGRTRGGNITGASDLYDPAMNTWSSTSILSTPRWAHTAALLGNGKLLIAGGFGTSGALASVELYDSTVSTSTLPSITVTVGPISTSQSTLDVSAVSPAHVTSGGTMIVTLTARDSARNRETSGGATIGFALGSGTGTGTFGNVTDNNNGTYTAIFVGTSGGTNTITATINGQSLASALPTITVTGPISVLQSTVHVSDANVSSGATIIVTLTARDSAGNQEISGGATVAFALGSGAGGGTFGSVTDHNDGTYTATFVGTIAGSNTITAMIDGQSLTSAPPTITVIGPADPTRSIVTVSASSIQVNAIIQVTLTPIDTNGNLVDPNGLVFSFALGAGTGDGNFSNVFPGGTDSGNFTATAVGTVTIKAYIGGVAVTSMQSVVITPSPWTPTGPMQIVEGVPGQVLQFSTATLLPLPDGRVLVAGGGNDDGTAGTELYNPNTNTWTTAHSLPMPTMGHTATLLVGTGQVLVAGGGNDAFIDSPSNSALYQPDGAGGTWLPTGQMLTPRAFHSAAWLPGDKVLVTGGNPVSGSSVSVLSSAEMYSNGSWSAAGNMSTPRLGHTETLLGNGKVLVAGGGDNAGSGLSSAELFDPAVSSGNPWSSIASMHVVRVGATATLLKDGRVLVAGGDSSGTAELFNPATNTWTYAASLITPRSGHTATLLNNGEVLVVGGDSSTGQGSFSTAEVYDPVSDRWSSAGTLAGGGFFGHTATLLSNGQVLIAGGGAVAQLYSPPATAHIAIPTALPRAR
jgi:N-acetylneuraminic acid mutarotase